MSATGEALAEAGTALVNAGCALAEADAGLALAEMVAALTEAGVALTEAGVDMLLAEAGTQRIGIGYDVHAFAAADAERALILGGVNLEYERGLLGHSDADVLAHAIADALLGAARLGDIGQHFPDTDPTYAGADSLKLLAHVGQLLQQEGWQIADIDSVVVAEAPKLAPHRDAMRENLAAALQIKKEQVGVKATTSERLGFTGRGEGIAAQAVALLTKVATAPHPIQI